MKKTRYFILNVFLPLLFGTTIYVCFRDNALFLTWLPQKVLMPPVILEWAASKSWFVYNMPDALWMYAFVSCLLLIWWQQRRIGMFYGLGALSAACMSELLQSYGWQAGTYDLLDIYYYVIATVAV